MKWGPEVDGVEECGALRGSCAVCGIDMGVLARIPSECYMVLEGGVERVIGRVGRGRDLERGKRRG